jgi:hypothetical protein
MPEISASPAKSLQNFPMKSDSKNPPKILRRLHYQKIPTKHQKISNKIPKNHQKSSVDPHYQQNTKKYQQSTTKIKNHKLSDQRTQRNRRKKGKKKRKRKKEEIERKRKRKKKKPEKHPLGFIGVGP